MAPLTASRSLVRLTSPLLHLLFLSFCSSYSPIQYILSPANFLHNFLARHSPSLHLASSFFSLMPSQSLKSLFDAFPNVAVDDPRKVVKVVASDGKTGDQRDLAYTNCKVIGNGSFGIVFQAKLLDDSTPSDIAIKKVLQDKRFKVRAISPTQSSTSRPALPQPHFSFGQFLISPPCAPCNL